MVRKHARRAVKAAFAIALAIPIVLGGTANAEPSATTITIGTKNFTEQYVLGQLYKQALEAKGFKVAYKENIGSSELIDTRSDERQDQLLPGVHGDHRARISRRPSHRRRRPTYMARRSFEAEARLHAAEADAVLRHRLVRGAEDDGAEVRPEDDLRREEGAEPVVRRLSGVRQADHLPARPANVYGLED